MSRLRRSGCGFGSNIFVALCVSLVKLCWIKRAQFAHMRQWLLFPAQSQSKCSDNACCARHGLGDDQVTRHATSHVTRHTQQHSHAWMSHFKSLLLLGGVYTNITIFCCVYLNMTHPAPRPESTVADCCVLHAAAASLRGGIHKHYQSLLHTFENRIIAAAARRPSSHLQPQRMSNFFNFSHEFP